MRKQRTPKVLMARIVKDVRDGRRDYFIPKTAARRLYEEGKLHIDLTNSKTEWVYLEVDGYDVRGEK